MSSIVYLQQELEAIYQQLKTGKNFIELLHGLTENLIAFDD